MDVVHGSVFFGLLLPLLAIIAAICAFSLVRRRAAPARDDRARVAELEAQVRALLYRVWTLEQSAAREPTADGTAIAEPPAPPPPSSAPETPPAAAIAAGEPVQTPEPRAAARDLEQRIGSRWATWIGVLAIFFAIGLFLKWSFENELLGPGARVLLGLAAGLGFLAIGLVLGRRSDLRLLSEGLAGLGLGTFYLSLFGAEAVYGLIGSGAALAAMCAVTLLGVLIAVLSNRQATAVLAMLGGFLSPVVLRVTEPDDRNLLAYLLILDLVVLAAARFRTWPALTRLAWAGSAALAATLLFREPESPHPLSRLALLSALFVLFLAAPLLQPLARRHRIGETDSLLVVANAAGYFWAVYVTLETWHPHAAGPYALGLAIVYRLVAADYAARIADDEATVVVHEGVAWTFLTLAVAVALSGRWITLAWAVQGTALAWSAARVATPVAAWGGAGALLLAAWRAAAVDSHEIGEPPVWNATYLVHLLVVATLAIGGALVVAARPERLRRLTGRALRTLLWLAAVLLLALLLWREPQGLWPATLLTAELLVVGWLARRTGDRAWLVGAPIMAAIVLARVLVADDTMARIATDSLLSAPFGSRVAACAVMALCGAWLRRSPGAVPQFASRVLSGVAGLVLLYVLSVQWTRYGKGASGWTTQVGLSVLWTLYAAAVLAWGFVRSRPRVRYAALALLGFTVIKVFYVDLAAVRTAYRIVSFLVLGVVLLGVSLLYQKMRSD